MSVQNPFESEATNVTGDYKTLDAGMYPGALVILIDLGTHTGTSMQDGSTFESRKILLGWEVIGEVKDDGTPHIFTTEYNVADKSGKKSKLRIFLESWRGSAFSEGEKYDVAKYLGKTCMLNIVHGMSKAGKVFAKVDSVTQAPKGFAIAAPVTPLYKWFFGCGKPYDEPKGMPWHMGRPVQSLLNESREGLDAAAAAGFASESAPAPAANGSKKGKATATAAAVEKDDTPF